jgi:hypothetical protein
MKKFGVLLLVILLSIAVAGIYGVLHDQVTYTICPEYYTKFKFIQFGITDEDLAVGLPGKRQMVAVVGFLATWWTGLIIGVGLGLTGFIIPGPGAMLRACSKAILLTLVIAVATGLVGFFYGRFWLASTGVDWWLPEHLVHKNDFITVGSIHNFSYLGGLLGLVAGITYLVRHNHRLRQDRLASG